MSSSRALQREIYHFPRPPCALHRAEARGVECRLLMGSFLPETPGEYEKSSCFPLINEAVGCLICSLTSTPALQLLLLTPGWETCLLDGVLQSYCHLPAASPSQPASGHEGAAGGGSAGCGWERALGPLWMSSCCRRSPPRSSAVAGGERWLSWQRLLRCSWWLVLGRGVGARVGRCQAAWLPYVLWWQFVGWPRGAHLRWFLCSLPSR